MPYAKFETAALTDPKVIASGPSALVWMKGILYSVEHLTDGFIPAHVLPILAIGLPGNPIGHAKKLVSVGLWIECEGGYTVGAEKWARHQTTREQVDGMREQWKERKARQRERDMSRSHANVTRDSRVNHANVTPPEVQKYRSTEEEPPNPLRDPLNAIVLQDEFCSLWEAYRPICGQDLNPARAESYPKARQIADAETILAGVGRYRKFLAEGGDGGRPMKLRNWLDRRCWENEYSSPEAPKQVQNGKPKGMTPEEIARMRELASR